MDKRLKIAVPTGLAVGALVVGTVFATAPGPAGADQLPDPGMTVPAPNFPGGSEDCDEPVGPGDQFQCDVIAALGQLDEGKKNEDGLAVRTGQVDVELSTGNEFQTGRAHVSFGENPFDSEADEVTVVITPVRNLDRADNAPVVVQVSENSPTGFNVRALNKHMEGIDGQEVRFTFVAYAS